MTMQGVAIYHQIFISSNTYIPLKSHLQFFFPYCNFVEFWLQIVCIDRKLYSHVSNGFVCRQSYSGVKTHKQNIYMYIIIYKKLQITFRVFCVNYLETLNIYMLQYKLESSRIQNPTSTNWNSNLIILVDIGILICTGLKPV